MFVCDFEPTRHSYAALDIASPEIHVVEPESVGRIAEAFEEGVNGLKSLLISFKTIQIRCLVGVDFTMRTTNEAVFE